MSGARCKVTSAISLYSSSRIAAFRFRISSVAYACTRRTLVVTVLRPAERLVYEFTADEPGNWAFHCHLLYHMEAGMFRFFNVPLSPKNA